MGRILVYPEELEAISSQVGKAMAELQALRDRLGSQLGSLNWETHHRALVEQLMGQAGQMAGSVAHAGEQMAAFLKKKAGDFVAADEGGAAGNHRAPDPSMALANAVRTSGLEDAGIAAVTGVAAAAAVPLVTNPGWVKQKYGPQFGGSPTTGDQRDPGVPAGVAAHPPADPFTAVVGAVPVVTVGGVKQFSPAFQQWADSFNRRVRAVWEGKATDHAGTSAERLVETYQLTPEKAEKIWTVAAANHVDPKLLLAILQQEGTGSFNTNPGNTAYYDGHGPQPDFDADLQAALDGPIMGKLRLYPKAVAAGFKGTWVDWVNWYTPMDTKGMQGAPGVYAADIHWGDGVAGKIRAIDAALGTSTGDPIAQYSEWMGQHPDIFQPAHIGGDFVIKPGLASGMRRPELAVWADSDTPPYPGAYLKDGFWWFSAPDEYCWHIERRT